ncbi:transglycosylase family protein [Streptomyces sp. NBC_01525]|uniref:transglycosylase family protein n=1 Tax=Streptomyces sp. NBC_01525 TaxID=2903893 RepID=UPI00386E64B2
MRTGNGRHRRPRQAPALFVTAGVTGAGLALPLLGAGAAHAADATTWDRVAQCESGGIWSSAGGNGFYGGLQLTLDMWRDHGGLEYAARPDLASRAQQIAVAQAILADRGPEAWPRCAAGAGLTEGGGIPDVDPGGTVTTPPADADGADTGTGTDTGQDGTSIPDGPDRSTTDPSAPKGEPDPSGTPDPSTSPGTPDATDSPEVPEGSGRPGRPGPSDDPSGHTSTPSEPSHPSRTTPPADGGGSRDGDGSGRHRGGSDANGGVGGSDRAPGRHASRGGERTDPGEDAYTVRPGDNLSAIVEARELPGGWPALYERNEDVIGDDPDLIHPGQLLDLGH